jgi:hypothetical protein
LRHFREEYIEHIVLKTCRASVCEGLVRVPCQHACPAGVNVPEYLALAGEGRLHEAADVIRRRNPLISVCGRVCDHPCESKCRRSEIDRPLAIRALKRYIADNLEGDHKPLVRASNHKPPVAIIGSGPAGLACGYFLALMDRRSVMFEAQPVPGGMLALGIPEYRLPKDTLNKEIAFILSHGVDLHTSSPVPQASDLLSRATKPSRQPAAKGSPSTSKGAVWRVSSTHGFCESCPEKGSTGTPWSCSAAATRRLTQPDLRSPGGRPRDDPVSQDLRGNACLREEIHGALRRGGN